MVSTSVIHAIIASLRNDLYCVDWGVKLYSLTHPCNYRYYYSTDPEGMEG